jgi:hypothetical protein
LVSILFYLLSSKKVVPFLIKVEKICVKKIARGSKKSVFLSWFQKGAEHLVLSKRGKIIPRKTDSLGLLGKTFLDTS